MVDIVYANAYKEVIEILKHVSKEDYDKIPEEKIKLFETNANNDYSFTYDINKTLDEQNVSKKAKTIIAILFRDYWATDIQREKIKAKEQYDRKLKEEQSREIYNPDNIFKKKEALEESKPENSNSLIQYKEFSFFKKIIAKIKCFFKK